MWLKVLVSAALLMVYAPTLSEMGGEWWHDTYAVHGMFVPLFAAHFVWIDRKRLHDAVGAGDSKGLLWIAGALGLLAGGYATGSLLLKGWALVVALAGTLLWLYGREWLRAAAFPVGFLFLMVPLPRSVVASVTTHLQLFAAGFAGGVLELVGVPSYQEGVYVFLPGITLEIAEICNGLRFLMALLVLTVAFAELTMPTFTRKVLLVLSVFPVAIVANATRVAVVSLAAHYWGPSAASGPLHHNIGKAVWILTLVPMGVIALALRRSRTTPEEKLSGLSESAT